MEHILEFEEFKQNSQPLDESVHSAASELLMSMMRQYQPLMAFLKWEDTIIDKFDIDPKTAKEISNKLYDKKGSINKNHLKQLANAAIKDAIKAK